MSAGGTKGPMWMGSQRRPYTRGGRDVCAGSGTLPSAPSSCSSGAPTVASMTESSKLEGEQNIHVGQEASSPSLSSSSESPENRKISEEETYEKKEEEEGSRKHRKTSESESKPSTSSLHQHHFHIQHLL